MPRPEMLRPAVTRNWLDRFALPGHEIHVLAPSPHIQHMGACPALSNWGTRIKSQPHSLARAKHRYAITHATNDSLYISKLRVLATLCASVPKRHPVRPVVFWSSLFMVNSMGIAHLLHSRGGRHSSADSRSGARLNANDSRRVYVQFKVGLNSNRRHVLSKALKWKYTRAGHASGIADISVHTMPLPVTSTSLD